MAPSSGAAGARIAAAFVAVSGTLAFARLVVALIVRTVVRVPGSSFARAIAFAPSRPDDRASARSCIGERARSIRR
jgi:hypothetical protein